MNKFKMMLAAIFLVMAAPVKADPFGAQGFAFHGTCDGNDFVYRWSIENRTGWNLQSWLWASIKVYAIEILRYSGNENPVGPTTWWMIGSTFSSGDTITFMSPNDDHVYRDFGPGRDILIPGMGQPDSDASHYLDLHGSCFGGGPVSFWVVLYYTEVKP